jgi:hypothetical protein
MTINLEKVFFGHILGNRKFIRIVEAHFFKNKEIQFVYKVLKDYLTEKTSAQVPTAKQIWEMVSLVDQNGLITKEILKSILSVDMKEYDYENFILPKFNAWVLSNKLKSGTVDMNEHMHDCECVCVRACARERKERKERESDGEREREKERERKRGKRRKERK